jgi:hypothetical protein
MTRRTKSAPKLLETTLYCEYCHLTEDVVPQGLWIDHIIPRIKGGTDESTNLCVSCVSCNQAKGKVISAHDPVTNKEVRLFNPRQDNWHAHFRWSQDKLRIEGLTPSGRATVESLKMNKTKMLKLRRLLIRLKLHPPD